MTVETVRVLQPGDIIRHNQRLMLVTRIGSLGKPMALHNNDRMVSIHARELNPSEEILFWETDQVEVTAHDR